MSNASEGFTQRMPSIAIGGIVAVIVLVLTIGFVWISERPSQPAVTAEPVIETVSPEQTQAADSATEDPNAPDAVVETSGQSVTPEDTGDETSTVDVTLPDDG